MNKHLTSGLILATLLTGCQAHVDTTPDAYDVETAVKTGLTAKTLPAGTKTIGPKAQAQAPLITMKNPKLTPVLSNKAVAAGNTGTQAAAADGNAGPVYLKVEAPPSELKLIPMMDDENKVTAIKAQPEDGKLVWRLQAVNGPQTIAKVHMVLKVESTQTPPEQPSHDMPNGKPAPASTPTPESQPVEFDRAASEMLSTTELSAGASSTFTLALSGADGLKFLADNPYVSRMSVTATLLTDGGEPLKGEDGQPVQLKSAVVVW